MVAIGASLGSANCAREFTLRLDSTTLTMLPYLIATWVSFVLTNLSFAAMGIELRRRGEQIDWLSYSFNLRVRLTKAAEVTKAYWEFKRTRQELPLFCFAMAVFATGIVAIPTVALFRYFSSGS